ncbi:hypothetical protein [Sphingomonas sp. Leaf412]|uniref:hypothetical protein n=1 Tax=Sphingomonas sp. Leaf412 TaxID=1736370 RepID=UPI0012E3D5A2|nr:hypothetical protein [Sphingomonas sp. Leaf412]
MSDTIRKYRTLVEKLYIRTKSDLINWKWDEEQKIVSSKIADLFVDLKKGVNDNFEDLYSVVVYGPAGHVVDEFNDEYISSPSAKPGTLNFDSYFFLMDALYEMAYRKSIGADKALDQILTYLDEIEDPF